MALNINGRMKVKTLKSDFKKEFGLTLRVYDGRSFADDEATLASIRKGDSKGGEFSPKRNMKVGNFEDKMMELFGIKTQISGSDDSYLCDNDKTLAGALEADEKLMGKRTKREKNSKENSMESKEVTKNGDATSELNRYVDALLAEIGEDKEAIAKKLNCYETDAVCLAKILEEVGDKLGEWSEANEEKVGKYEAELAGMIQNSEIKDIWKYALVLTELTNSLFFDIEIDASKYIEDSIQAIDVLEEFINNNEPSEDYADFVIGIFYLAMLTAQNGAAIEIWVSQIGDPFNSDGYGSEVFQKVDPMDGLILEKFIGFVSQMYGVDFDSEENYDEMEGQNWENISEEIGANFL